MSRGPKKPGAFPVCVWFSAKLAYVLMVTYIDPKLKVLYLICTCT